MSLAHRQYFCLETRNSNCSLICCCHPVILLIRTTTYFLNSLQTHKTGNEGLVQVYQRSLNVGRNAVDKASDSPPTRQQRRINMVVPKYTNPSLISSLSEKSNIENVKKKLRNAVRHALQIPTSNTIVRDSHTQEDGNRPIKQFAGNHEKRNFWFILAGEM